MAEFPQWIIGVILIIFGSLGNNLGNNLVSLGHKEENEVKKAEKTKIIDESNLEEGTAPPRTDGTVATPEDKKKEEGVMSWRTLGTIIFIFGNLFTFGSFGFGAQSLLASLESIQFVSNLVFAKYCHNETVTKRMMIATASIVLGNVLVVIFAEHHAILYDSDGMIKLYQTNSAYHAYLVLAFVAWAITNYIYLKYHHRRVKENTLMWKHSFVEPFCYAMSSAIVGTQAVLNSKCMSMLIQVTIRGHKQEFGFWFIYFILATWVLLVAYWLQRLDCGLALFPPLFIIPVMQVFFVFFAIVCGGIYFEEFNAFDTPQWIGFVFGVSMILGGVYGLAPTDMVLQTPHTHVAPMPQTADHTCTAGVASESGLDISKSAVGVELVSQCNSSFGSPQVDKSALSIMAGEGGSELDQLMQVDRKDKPARSSFSAPPPAGTVPAPLAATAELINLYGQLPTNDNTCNQREGEANNNSPTNGLFIQPSLSPNGFSHVKLEPLDGGASASCKKNRKVVKRGPSSSSGLGAGGDNSAATTTGTLTQQSSVGNPTEQQHR